MQGSPTPIRSRGSSTVAFKVADEIRCRLFDHRQFTGGEIRFLQRELEEKRQWKESDNLEDMSLTAMGTKATVDRVVSRFTGDEINGLSSKLDCLISVTDNLLANEVLNEQKRQQRISERRQEAQTEMQKFQAELDAKRQEIENSFKAKEDELIEHYVNLEKTLKVDVYHNTRQN